MDIGFQRRIEAVLREAVALRADVEALRVNAEELKARVAELEAKFEGKRPRLTLPKVAA